VMRHQKQVTTEPRAMVPSAKSAPLFAVNCRELGSAEHHSPDRQSSNKQQAQHKNRVPGGLAIGNALLHVDSNASSPPTKKVPAAENGSTAAARVQKFRGCQLSAPRLRRLGMTL
jgi:hypothetical protein